MIPDDGAMPVKALTLWRPWPTVILLGPKRVENRPLRWTLPDGGLLLAIHSGRTWDDEGERAIREEWPEFEKVPRSPRHPTLGVGLVGAVWCREVRAVDDMPGDAAGPLDPWAFGPFCYLLEDPVAFPSRIEVRGRQGLWSLGAELEARVREMWGGGQEKQAEASREARDARAELLGRRDLRGQGVMFT